MSDAKELSPLDGLTDAQRRGAACVHCGKALTNATAMDLGCRQDRVNGHLTAWFPRACPQDGTRPWPPSSSSRR